MNLKKLFEILPLSRELIDTPEEEDAKRRAKPMFSLFDLGDEPRETSAQTDAILDEIMNPQRPADYLAPGAEGPQRPLSEAEGPDDRINRIGRELEMQRQKLSTQQKPELTVDEYAKLKKSEMTGQITPALLLRMEEAEKRNQAMADAVSGRQQNTFQQQREQQERGFKQTNEDALLSPDEAMKLGVVYGTARKAAKGLEPKKIATDTEKVTSLYANRLEQSGEILNGLENFAMTANPLWFTTQRNLPDVANRFKDPQFQSLEQAMRNFLNATLRRESGAVISPTEFAEGFRQYFPQPGDKPGVVEQKRKNRLLVTQGMIKGSGSAYTPLGNEMRTEQKVRVFSPDGTEGEIPLSQLKDAISQGYKPK